MRRLFELHRAGSATGLARRASLKAKAVQFLALQPDPAVPPGTSRRTTAARPGARRRGNRLAVLALPSLMSSRPQKARCSSFSPSCIPHDRLWPLTGDDLRVGEQDVALRPCGTRVVLEPVARAAGGGRLVWTVRLSRVRHSQVPPELVPEGASLRSPDELLLPVAREGRVAASSH